MYKESETVELKRELTKNIKKEIVAFANSKGGKIYIGINDDGDIAGINNINENIEALSGMIRDGIIGNLTLYTNIEIDTIEQKDIIILHVTSAPSKPYYLADKGLKPSGVYLRHGTSTIQATDEIIRKMIMDSSIQKYEEEISKNQNLTFEYADNIFKEKQIPFSKNKFKSLKLISNNNKYNNLALLLSDQNPYTIKCAIFEGNNKTIFKDRKELTGSILKQLNDAFHYLNLSNHINSTFKGLNRIDKKDYPDFALRESLLNAIIHRSYYFDASILLSIFDDRIEINSIGGLIDTLTLNDIYNGVSDSRNPNFAELFHRLELVENYGTGIGRIMKEYEDSDKKPLIELSDNVFKITLPNRNYQENKKISNNVLSNDEIIINYLKQNKTIRRENIENILQLSKSGARKTITKMINNNIIIQIGTGKNTYYVLK